MAEPVSMSDKNGLLPIRAKIVLKLPVCKDDGDTAADEAFLFPVDRLSVEVGRR